MYDDLFKQGEVRGYKKILCGRPFLPTVPAGSKLTLMTFAASGTGPLISAGLQQGGLVFDQLTCSVEILIVEHPYFRKHLRKGNFSGQTRYTLILDHTVNAGLLKALLAHLDFDQAL